MKNVFFLSLVLLLFAACSKQELPVAEDAVIEADFIPADQTTADMAPPADFMLNAKAASGPCCNLNSIAAVSLPWDPTLVNLNVNYDVNSTTQSVQLQHYQLSPWTYLGANKIGSSYSTCTNKSINMSVGHLPSGNIRTYANVFDTNGGSCGDWVFTDWVNP